MAAIKRPERLSAVAGAGTTKALVNETAKARTRSIRTRAGIPPSANTGVSTRAAAMRKATSSTTRIHSMSTTSVMAVQKYAGILPISVVANCTTVLSIHAPNISSVAITVSNFGMNVRETS